MTQSALFLAQAGAEATVSTGEAISFWVLGPIAVAGALGMIFARNAVHSALWLVLTMLSLGMLYLIQQAPFLGFTQIIVYTGAIMMLFLFVLMMVGRESSDSVVEVLRGQRLTAAVLGIGVAGVLAGALTRALTDVTPAPPLDPWSPEGGGAGGLGRLIFTDYLFPFELTSALLITAGMGAMVLTFTDRHAKTGKRSQRELVVARFRGEYERPSPKPGPGVFATSNSVATPALLPDGSVAPESLSELIESTSAARLEAERKQVTGETPQPDAHALVGSEQDAAKSAEAEREDGDR
ncbi:NADH-quinone oxidoreductase subunit J [Prauserella sp. PE36]|uniref:NADH-quinone oxidoreductase subunit J n=1 Tax=Prauserella endophytica TaxID=1592324 RepID=A0ABY2SDJ6_9PSEU|nr:MULTISPECIES: NADH-quinone oxidoreductase subunit J [Prauserella]PXY35148.1 NADH:ubiquinone oxidoreductase subunit J [Prauserella coralliicola]RBM21275.1 NADH-quinone oxidoreductase subunit J [Prauserella sp. PE36]TKG73682.1 NADH-quinone oxidoreductase subunit J [Prauserella endophytica]